MARQYYDDAGELDPLGNYDAQGNHYYVFKDNRPRNFTAPDHIYRERGPEGPKWYDPYPPREAYPGERSVNHNKRVEAFIERAKKAGDQHYENVRKDLEAQRTTQNNAPRTSQSGQNKRSIVDTTKNTSSTKGASWNPFKKSN